MVKSYLDSANELFKAELTLKTEEECKAFFEDLCTVKEILDMAQRYDVAKLLSVGNNYVEIAKATGASTATISRVRRNILNNEQCVMRDVIYRNGFADDSGKKEDGK